MIQSRVGLRLEIKTAIEVQINGQLNKLISFGLIGPGSSMDNVFLEMNNLLDYSNQTVRTMALESGL